MRLREVLVVLAQRVSVAVQPDVDVRADGVHHLLIQIRVRVEMVQRRVVRGNDLPVSIGVLQIVL